MAYTRAVCSGALTSILWIWLGRAEDDNGNKSAEYLLVRRCVGTERVGSTHCLPLSLFDPIFSPRYYHFPILHPLPETSCFSLPRATRAL